MCMYSETNESRSFLVGRGKPFFFEQGMRLARDARHAVKKYLSQGMQLARVARDGVATFASLARDARHATRDARTLAHPLQRERERRKSHPGCENPCSSLASLASLASQQGEGGDISFWSTSVCGRKRLRQ